MRLELIRVEGKIRVKVAAGLHRKLRLEEAEELWFEIVETQRKSDLDGLVVFKGGASYTYFSQIWEAYHNDGKVILPYANQIGGK